MHRGFPHGYQTMSLIALVPSWCHKATDSLLADWDTRLANDAERSLLKARGWATGVPAPPRNGSIS